MGSSTVRSWLVSTIDSRTIVFVWLLTHLQGASTALAKCESTFVNYILLEMDGRFGVSHCQRRFDGLDWGKMKLGNHYVQHLWLPELRASAKISPLTTQNGGKCQHCWTSSLYSSCSCHQLLLNHDASILSFHILRQQAFTAILSTSTSISNTCFHSFSFVITQNYNYSILHGLDIVWFMGLQGFELRNARGGVLDNFKHGKLNCEKLISQHNR